MKKGILIDTEKQIFKANGENIGNAEELIITFKNGKWEVKAIKNFSFNNYNLRDIKNDNR
ncbi:hypothetical protein EXN57_13340 [Clostridium botulinum]|nr:hypothetical protein [Clostridium botulinum]NFD35112.1 hypothetical protein [Clostridium botulinum]NFD59964.1 hypothetical protein [Clostridium botulinum]NFE02251.1 hypothetical protein [Clostridium botulinum]